MITLWWINHLSFVTNKQIFVSFIDIDISLCFHSGLTLPLIFFCFFFFWLQTKKPTIRSDHVAGLLACFSPNFFFHCDDEKKLSISGVNLSLFIIVVDSFSPFELDFFFSPLCSLFWIFEIIKKCRSKILIQVTGIFCQMDIIIIMMMMMMVKIQLLRKKNCNNLTMIRNNNNNAINGVDRWNSCWLVWEMPSVWAMYVSIWQRFFFLSNFHHPNWFICFFPCSVLAISIFMLQKWRRYEYFFFVFHIFKNKIYPYI